MFKYIKAVTEVRVEKYCDQLIAEGVYIYVIVMKIENL